MPGGIANQVSKGALAKSLKLHTPENFNAGTNPEKIWINKLNLNAAGGNVTFSVKAPRDQFAIWLLANLDRAANGLQNIQEILTTIDEG